MLLLDTSSTIHSTRSRFLTKAEHHGSQNRVNFLFKFGKPVKAETKVAYLLMEKYKTIYAVDEKHEQINERDKLDTLAYKDLISLCARMDLPISGKKEEILQRAREALKAGKIPRTPEEQKAKREADIQEATAKNNAEKQAKKHHQPPEPSPQETLPQPPSETLPQPPSETIPQPPSETIPQPQKPVTRTALSGNENPATSNQPPATSNQQPAPSNKEPKC